jgi:RNA polymerase-binding protein DksA
MLKPEDVRQFRDRLQAQREQIRSRIAANRRNVTETVRDDIGVGDVEDDAHLTYDREFELQETDRDRRELAQIDKALERIDQGTYGISEVSGKPIPIERLEALPSATTLAGEGSSESG